MPRLHATLAWGALVQLFVVAGLLAVAGRLWSPSVPTDPMESVPHAPRRPLTPPYVFPDGSRMLFPGHRLIALYGAPGAPVLGVLGHQDVNHSVSRVKQLAKTYQANMQEVAYPTFEMIATVASAYPTENHDYSAEVDMQVLSAWVQVAKKNDIYVILDLQPGRTDFLTQAKRLSPLLREPNVGLALDPEWRLTPTQVPLKQIGSVSMDEVNRTGRWLAQLTRSYKLPQKLFLLHQFRSDTLPQRIRLDTSQRELAYAIQMDGQGSQAQKRDTWQVITRQPPPYMHFGWKNFYQKDTTVLSPTQTMHIRPKPWYVSYQ